jgi:hypothetical protein
MFLLLVAFTAAVLTVPLAGGSLRRLGDVRLHAPWLLLVAIGIQATLTLWDGSRSWWRVAGYLSSYPLGIAFLILNRRVPGVWLIVTGATLNFAAIAANGGVMPASPQALALAGLPVEASGVYTNSAALADPHLLFLGDILAVPASWPFANVFSVGDVCIVLGAAVAVHGICGSRLVRRGWPAQTPGRPQESRPVTRNPASRTR